MSARRTALANQRALIIRARKLDREAAFDLCRTIRPRSVTELVQQVCPVSTPSCVLFDVLADAFSALEICNRIRTREVQQ